MCSSPIFIFFFHTKVLHAQLIMFVHSPLSSSCGINIVTNIAILDGDPCSVIMWDFQHPLQYSPPSQGGVVYKQARGAFLIITTVPGGSVYGQVVHHNRKFVVVVGLIPTWRTNVVAKGLWLST